MVVKSFTDEQLNFFKFSTLVVDEFPKALRQTFKYMWENVGPGSNWDDSEGVRDSFWTKEGGKTKVPTDKSYEEWDCTALFQATIHAQTFALPDSKGNLKTLGELYVKPRGFMPNGSFHASVLSPGGNQAETFALAIDQLRLLRNSLSHLTSSKKINKTTFDQYTELAKDAFKALGVATDSIDEVKSLPSSYRRGRQVGTRNRTFEISSNERVRQVEARNQTLEENCFFGLGRLLWYDCLEQNEIYRS